MRQKSRFSWALALALVASAPASAQLELSSSTFDGGGGTSSGGSFEVSGTAGQFDAGFHSGGSFDLESGFWNSQNPAVPVELQSFEIVSSHPANSCRAPAAVADRPSPRRQAEPPLEVARRDAAAPERAVSTLAHAQARKLDGRHTLVDRSDLETP